MLHKRSAHKPSDAFLRDFQRKFSGVAATPYTTGAGIMPDQLVQALPGLVSNPTLLPSPRYSLSPPGRTNCSYSAFNVPMCTALPDQPVDASLSQAVPCNVGAQPMLLAPAYNLPQDPCGLQGPAVQYQDHLGDFSDLSAQHPREISPPDSQLGQSSALDETQSVYDGQQPLRFQVTLHAPTATYNPTRQNPVTYLNRRQGYKISIIDTAPPVTLLHPVRYRTHFRIGFDNDHQRADPVAAWRLWRDNRGLNEASRGDGQLRAVEFVDVMSNVIRGRPPGSQVALESSSVDGFSIVWLADPQSGHAGCEAYILFNFLSTDFTLSKGVQGAPLRLYAKTELFAPDASAQPPLSTAEICYCKVKLFRDHGSERKLSNDAVKLKKTIDKVHQRLDTLDSGAAQGRLTTGKRKRGKGKPPATARKKVEPFLTMTHDFSARDELQTVISELEAVLSSSRPRSTLSLRGDAQDDPDRSPVVLSNPLQGSPTSIDEQLVKHRLGRETTGSFSPMSTSTQDHTHAVACFYILRRIDGQVEDYYHALYLNERTLSDLLCHLSQMYQTEISHISHAIRVNAGGLRIVIDDVVREIPSGQDMIAEISKDGDDTVGSPPRFRVTLFY
ncbi:uncharacterized protein KD926_002731 [Aspergillus affinis]|uniref:uncharacterized protein n=1 Tax=Aspergillus affinis TaxID=1070780 RepID=UPI0022FED451|nr:uncharacterized protein KD926_002731 [Aspergillus affinis]KAI9043840.1 hypothetical protein KD926_002731 [Aspergillus affinis]